MTAKNGQRSQNAGIEAVVLARAHPGRSKSSIGRRRWVQTGFCVRSGYTKLWPTWKSSLQPNQKRCWSTALQKLRLQSFTVEAQRVGRARSPLRAGAARTGPAYRFESCFPRPYGRGYEALVRWWMKNTLLILDAAGRGVPALPIRL